MADKSNTKDTEKTSNKKARPTGFRCPRGYKAFGDLSDIALLEISDKLESHEVSEEFKKVPVKETNTKTSRILIFDRTQEDRELGIKDKIYLDTIKTYIGENEYLGGVKYATDFNDNMYILYLFVEQ